MTPDMAPKPSKNEHTVRLSDGDEKMARKIAADRGLAFAEILSDAIKIGLPTLVEHQNKASIYKRTSAKAEIIDLVDGIPQAKLDEAIAYLKGMK